MKATSLLNRAVVRAMCAGFGVAILAMGQIAQAEVMTLDQSIKYALEHNPSVGVAKENIGRSEALVKQATSQGLPKVNLQGTYTRLDKVSAVQFGEDSVALNNLNSQAANLTVAQPIDIFGVVKTAKHAAKQSEASAQHDYEQVRNDTTLLVKQAYYAVLRAQKYQDVQSKRVDQLQAHLDETKLHLKAGTAAPFDVLRAETEVANAKQGLLSAQNSVDLAKSAFNNTLGRDLSASVELEEPKQPEYAELKLESCISSASTVRPEVMKMRTQQDLTGDMVHIAKLGNKPQVNFQWVMNQNLTTTMFNPRSNTWTGYVTVSMPLYDGGRTKASVQEAEANAKNTKLGYQQTLMGVTLDTKQAYLSLNDSRERIGAAEKALEQARESMRLSEVRYKAGVSTQVEVFDAQTALTQAETNHVNAMYDYYTSLAQLEKAVGGPTQMAKLMESATKVASEPATTGETKTADSAGAKTATP